MPTSAHELRAADDEALALAARDGSHVAFGELYRRYEPVFAGYARPRLGSLQRWLGDFAWGGVLEGLLFGVIVGAAIAVSGAGGEFIYFQF